MTEFIKFYLAQARAIFGGRKWNLAADCGVFIRGTCAADGKILKFHLNYRRRVIGERPVKNSACIKVKF